jgi:hypothetical protein
MGPRTECVPREDDDALLHKIDRYTQLLGDLRDPGRVIVTAIAGPVPQEVTVQFDSQNRPEVQPSCIDVSNQGATPAVRIQAFASYFNPPADMSNWAFTSVCTDYYGAIMQGIGSEIAYRLAP